MYDIHYCLCSRPEPEDSDDNDNAQEWEELHSEDTYQDSKLLKLHDEGKFIIINIMYIITRL